MSPFVNPDFADFGFVEDDSYSFLLPSSSLSSLLADPEANINVAVELSSISKSDGTSKIWYAARFVDGYLLTAQPTFLPFLSSVGPLSQSLSEDAQFGGLAESSAGSITLMQENPDYDRLSDLLNYTFAGGVAIIKIGKLQADDYANYYTYRTFAIEQDPDMSLTETGIKLTFPLSSVLNRLSTAHLGLKRYVGIPHCLRVQTTSSVLTITRISAYDVSRYTVSIKFSAAAVPSSIFTLTRKYISTSDCHWWIRILVTGGTLGWVQVLSTSAGTLDVVISAQANYCDGLFHTVVFSRDNDQTSYLMIDGIVIGTVIPTGAPNLTLSNIQTLAGSGEDVSILDHRFMNRYIPPSEAMSLFSVRTDGTETGCQGLWRFDDNGGASANDYSANNNDCAISGVLNTDFSWQPSYLGEPELAGRSYPYVAGAPFNALSHLIDHTREIYRVASSDPETNGRTSIIKTRGIQLTQTVDYTDNNDGTFKMVSPEDDPVTVDVSQVTPSSANILSNVVAAITASEIDTNSAQSNALSGLLPWTIGYFDDTDATLQSALSEIISTGAFYREDELGQLYPDFLLPPLGLGPYYEPVLDFMGHWSQLDWGDIGDITGSRTICAWFKTHATDQSPTDFFSGSKQVFIRKFGSYTLEYITAGANAGKLRCGIGNAAIEVYSPAGMVQPNTWYFVAGVFDNSAHTLDLYLYPPETKAGGFARPTLVGSASGLPAVTDDSTGAFTSGYSVYGSVQHAHVWNVTKNASQLAGFVSSYPLGNEANIIANIHINEGTGLYVRETVTGSLASITYTSGLQDQRWVPSFTVDLNYTPSVKITNFKFLQPAWKILVHWAKNWKPLNDSDISSSVSQSQRLALRNPWKEVPFEDTEMKSRYPKAKEIRIDSPLADQDDAERLMRMLQTRFGEGIAIAVLEFSPGESISRKSCGLVIGEEIRLISPIPSQLAEGKNMKAIAIAPDPINLSSRIVLWGPVSE